MKNKIKDYYVEHKDGIKNACIGGLFTSLIFALVGLNATDKIIRDNNLQQYFYGKDV